MGKFIALGAAVAAIAIAAAAASAGNPNTLTLAVYGDAPYGTSNPDTAEFTATPAFISSINADASVQEVIHVGDIHSGSQKCTVAYDQSIYNLWTAFRDPLVYTPGDNEWSDCTKPKELPGSDFAADSQMPLTQLGQVRSIFFAHPGQTLGQNPMQVTSQADAFDPAHPEDAQFVENVMWQQSDVVFVTINLPGGSNNDQDVWFGVQTETPAQTQERTQRTAADLRWLDVAFGVAQRTHAAGVVIVAQADMWDPEKGAAHQTAYEPFVQSVASHAADLGAPALMFNGDSQVYRSDNPLSSTASCAWELPDACPSVAFMHPGYEVPNFRRVVVHGSTFPLEWLKLTVDPRANGDSPTAFGPFSWERQIQP
jgi:hypothetical protein